MSTGQRRSKLTPRDLRVVHKKLKAKQSTIDAEARRLGCYHATLRKELRRLVGQDEYNRVMWGHTKRRYGGFRRTGSAQATPEVVVSDPLALRAECSHCRGAVYPLTDGNGLVVLFCMSCGQRDVVVPRRVEPAGLGREFPRRKAG